MSWDVLLLSVPPGIQSLEGLPENFGASLGPKAEVQGVLAQLFPAMDFTDPTWGILESPDYSIEFSVGSEDPCRSLMLHVRGNEAAIAPIRVLCERTGWSAFDTSEGALLNFNGDPAKGLRAWLTYRAKVAPGAPLRGVSMPAEKGRVYFDGFGPSKPSPSPPARPWWQFWK